MIFYTTKAYLLQPLQYSIINIILNLITFITFFIKYFYIKLISFNENLNYIVRKMYYLNGESHREDGPAELWYDEDGNIEYEYFYLNGIECDNL